LGRIRTASVTKNKSPDGGRFRAGHHRSAVRPTHWFIEPPKETETRQNGQAKNLQA
jgi:hypothetical protein